MACTREYLSMFPIMVFFGICNEYCLPMDDRRVLSDFLPSQSHIS